MKKAAEAEQKRWREAMAQRFYHQPYIPLQVTPTVFGVEPSAVDRLAAVADPDGEAARRVAEWKKRQASWDEMWNSLRRRHSYKTKPINPKFFGTATVANL